MTKLNWPSDKNGSLLKPGTKVITPSGEQGVLVFIYGALRFRIAKHDNLQLNNTLVCCERWSSEDFEVIQR